MKGLIVMIKFWLKNRFVLFGLAVALFMSSQKLMQGSWLPTTETKDQWFYSGLFMVLFSLLFIEPYYSSPKNVITNTIPLLLVFLAIRGDFQNPLFWWFGILVFLALLLGSVTALALENKDRSSDYPSNKIADHLKNIVVFVGQGRVLYSAIFIYFLLTYYSIQTPHTLLLFVFWFLILTINPKSIHNTFSTKKALESTDQIGEIFGVQSKKIFLVKLYEDRRSIKRFDIVRFRYSMQDDAGMTIVGIIFDTYLLNQEKWAKVLQLSDPQKTDVLLSKNVVYKVTNAEDVSLLEASLRVSDFIGIVSEGSSIGVIKFEYSKKVDDLQEGDLLELKVGERKLFYQVMAGSTVKEKLEARNETGFIKGEALQLGEWRDGELSFQKFGWVPPINTAIFKASTSAMVVEPFSYPSYTLGVIPGTNLPSIINLHEAISHHTALIGVTGSGKSYLARRIIDQIKKDTKVICVDFNKEFVAELIPPPPNIITSPVAGQVAEKIDWINVELEKFGNQQNKAEIAKKQSEIRTLLMGEVNTFLDDGSCNIKIFELPDVTNTAGILDYTKNFFKVVFEIAKARQSSGTAAKICIVLEEAHTVIPEWNFSGSGDKSSQGLVNSIGQIALQGRKYGVGFLVIAQRTANVSKTVLTQCNTVICFQAFDETSFSFLGNYVGKEMAQALPNLKRYHAVVTGKAVKSNIPMIIDLKDG